MAILLIDAERSGYEPYQIYDTMTIGELIERLESIASHFDEGEDMKVYLRHDKGYTYGGITDWCFDVDEEYGDEEE